MSFELYNESLLTTIHDAWIIHGYYRLLLNMASLRLPYEKNDPHLNEQICEKILAAIEKNADPLITDGRYHNALHYLLAYGTVEQVHGLLNKLSARLLAKMCVPNLLGVTPVELLAERMVFLKGIDVELWEPIKKIILDLTYSSEKAKEISPEDASYSAVVGEWQDNPRMIYTSLWPTQRNLMLAREIIQKIFQNKEGFLVEVLEHNSETLPQGWDSALSHNLSRENDLRGKEIKISMARDLSPFIGKNLLLTLWSALERNGLDIGYIKPIDDNIEEYPCVQNILSPFTCVNTMPMEFTFTVSDMLLQDLQYFHEKPLLRMRIYLYSSHATHISGQLAYFSKYLKRKRPEWSFSVEEKMLEAVETGLRPTVKNDKDFNNQFMKKLSIFIDSHPWQIPLEKSIATIVDAIRVKQESYHSISFPEEKIRIFHEICFYLNGLAGEWDKLEVRQRKSLRIFLVDLGEISSHISHEEKPKNENVIVETTVIADKKFLTATYLKYIQSIRLKTLANMGDIADVLKSAITLLRENPDIDPSMPEGKTSNILHFIMIYNHTALLNELARSITSSHLHKLMAQKNEYDDTPLAIAHRKGDIPSLLCALHLIFLSKKAFDKNVHGITLFQRTFTHILAIYKNEKMKVNSFNKTVMERAKARKLQLSLMELSLTELEKKLESIINTFPRTPVHNPTLNCLLLGLQGASTLFYDHNDPSQERPWYLLFLVVTLLVKTGLLKNNSPQQLCCILGDCETLLCWAKDAFGFNEHREWNGKLRQGFWNVISETASSSKHHGDTTSAKYVENFIRVCQLEREQWADKLQCPPQGFVASLPFIPAPPSFG